MTSVTIPNSVTSIGDYAFSDCSGLTSVTIGNSVTSIGNYAFRNCSGLTSVTIPSSVTSIGTYAFGLCSSLTEVVFNAKNCTSMGSDNYPVFYGCSSLTKLTICDDVKTIPNYGFYGCSGLTSVTIPSSVTSIGNYAFRNCSGLTSVTIPNSVTTIGDYAFESCSGLRSITIGSSVTSISSSVFSGCYIKKAIWVTNTPPQGYANLSSAVHYVANEQYTSLSNVTIYPYLSSMFEVDGIKYVPVSPSNRTCDAIDCTYDTNAVNVNIGNKVTYKGVEMSVTSIQPYACYDNANINELKINFNGNIHEYAFNKCSAIKNVEIKVVEIGSYTFSNCSAIEHLTVHAEDIGNSCFSQSATKESAIFEISAKTIGDNSFKGCTKVESITLSDDLTSIGKNAFENCSNLKEIEIQNMVTSLGENSFSGCTSLENVTIGNGVVAINSFTFYKCTSLENVTIGNGVTKIYGSAFSGCSKLPKITIPSNVKTIGDNVFNNCTSLATVVINDRDTELSLGSNSSNPLFYYCPLDSVYIGGDITYPTSSSKGYSPFYRNTKLRSVVITDKETEISDNEFYGCSNLKNISMGDGIEKIGNWAFSGCSSLEHFAFGSGMKTIGEEAFSDCTAMTKLISRTTTPPTCGTQALDDINKWTCELFVPQSAVSAYQGANQWKEFFFIIGTESSGVESTFADDVNVSVENGNIVINGADNAKVEVYSVNGHCVYSGNVTIIPITAKGLYIVKVNGKSYKVIL